jgi:hypothetical protein
MLHLFFQTYVVSVFIWMLHMFHIYVASVFMWMLHMFCNDFSSIFRCFCKYFRCMFQIFFFCLYTYVANVSSGCFKSRSGIARIVMAPVADGQRPAAWLGLLPRAFIARCVSPSPLLFLPSLPFPLSHRGSSILARKRYPRSSRTLADVVAPSGLTAA